MKLKRFLTLVVKSKKGWKAMGFYKNAEGNIKLTITEKANVTDEDVIIKGFLIRRKKLKRVIRKKLMENFKKRHPEAFEIRKTI